MDEHTEDTNDDLTLHKLDQIIQKKKEEIAGLHKLLGSIEGMNMPVTEPEDQQKENDSNEKENK